MSTLSAWRALIAAGAMACRGALAADGPPPKDPLAPWGALEGQRWGSAEHSPTRELPPPVADWPPLSQADELQPAQEQRQQDSETGSIPPTEGGAPSTAMDASRLIAQAEDALKVGDVASARALFTAAGADPEAEHGLAETWDPDVLARMGAIGLAGDRQKADELYERASRHGWRDDSARH